MRNLTPFFVLVVASAAGAGQSNNRDVRSVKIDLNGDGKAETIRISPKTRKEGIKYTLTIGSQKVEVDLSGEPVDGIRIADIDKKDKYKEVEVYTHGPSDDFNSQLFRWDGKKIVDLGQTGGYFTTLGGGRLRVSSWVGFAVNTWVIGLDKASGKLKLVEKADLLKMDCKTTTKATLTLYATQECKTPIAYVAAGKKVELIAAKEMKAAKKPDKYGENFRILVKASDGTIGWAPMAAAMVCVKNFPCAD